MDLHRFLLASAAMLAALSGAAAALAQTAEPTISYTVRAGDTLIALSTGYLISKEDYRTIQDLNRISDPYRLPIGSTLLIPRRLLKTEPISGEISSFRGTVTADGQPATVGMAIRQGMRIDTGANAFVTVLFPDGSAISLPSQSRIRVDRLRRIMLTGGLNRTLRLEEGRSRSTVRPIKDPAGDFRVTTPLSVSAVRGTDFRVGFDPGTGRALTEVVAGAVGVAPDEVKEEISVAKGYGVVGTAAGIEAPTRLLPPPELTQIGRGQGDMVVVAFKPPLDGARRYRTQLATDIEFRDVIAETVTDEPTASFPGLGNVAFFVRLTAIAESGLEGLPATYASGRRVMAPGESAGLDVSGILSPQPQIGMTGNGRARPATIGPHPALR